MMNEYDENKNVLHNYDYIDYSNYFVSHALCIRKRKDKSTKKTFMGEIREENMIDRVRIERSMKEYRQEKNKKQEKIDGKNKTWQFEYTGTSKPVVNSIWNDVDVYDDNNSGYGGGTIAYKKMMKLDLLSSSQFNYYDKTFNNNDGTDVDDYPHHRSNTISNNKNNINKGTTSTTTILSRPPSEIKVRKVATNCSPDEILAIIKASMYELSLWLTDLAKIDYKKQYINDYDLLDVNDTKIMNLLLNTTIKSNDDEYDDDEYDDDEDDNDGKYAIPQYNDVINHDDKFIKSIIDVDGKDGVDDDDDDDDDRDGNDGDDDNDKDDIRIPTYNELIITSSSPVSMRNEYHERYSAPLSPQRPSSISPSSSPYTNHHHHHKIKHSTNSSNDYNNINHNHDNNLTSMTMNIPEFDKMTLIFNAFVGQQNNHALWLGKNDKLTRIKFEGNYR